MIGSGMLGSGLLGTADATATPAGIKQQDVVQVPYSGTFYDYVVGAGVTALNVDLAGAAGGTRENVGGKGGRVTATIPVTPGETLRIFVGGTGANSQLSANPGGFNGGGDGAAGQNGNGAGGGGATDIRRAPYGLADRIVVAPGGGGAGNWGWEYGTGGAGGAGGQVGADGTNGTSSLNSKGLGGTATAGGAGGYNVTYPGSAGTLGAGGAGGGVSNNYNGGGGGGGGGYYGGGGGGTNPGSPGNGGAGGGGGGSSYVVAAASNTLYSSGYQSGNGYAVLTQPYSISGPGSYGGGAYGASAYGGGQPGPGSKSDVVVAAAAAGQSTVTFGMTVVKTPGDIYAVADSPAPGDIVLSGPGGPNSLLMVPAGAASVTIGSPRVKFGNSIAPAGVSSNTSTLGKTIGLFQVSAGAASWLSNILTIIPQANYFTIYPSKPPYNTTDVLMGTRSGPGAAQGLFAYVSGAATVTAILGGPQRLTSTSQGVAADTANLGVRKSVSSTSAGRGGARDQFGAIGFWYLGSPVRMTATSNGIAALVNSPRLYQRMTLTSAGVGRLIAYLGSPVRATLTSAGRASDAFNLGDRYSVQATSRGVAACSAYMSTPVRVSLTSNGIASLVNNPRLYQRMTFTSNGIASLVNNPRMYQRMTATAGGRATVSIYLGTPAKVTSTSTGKATVSIYLGSPFHVFSTAAGKGGGIIYLGSRVYMAGTSSGRSAATGYLSGTFLLPNITMRGVAHWSLGPALMFAVPMQGIGHVNDLRMNPQKGVATSNGVGSMRDNSVLLNVVSNGSARGTEFDKPPFAFVVRAGSIWRYQSYYSQNDPRFNTYRGESMTGVVIYLSSRVGFANNHPTECHRSTYGTESGPSIMQGRSTFTFPYEMVAIANAGCRAFTSFRADDDPSIFPLANGSSATRGGVRARQFSPDYMYAQTNSNPYRVPTVFIYLSSRVYQQAVAAGRSTVVFLRFGEFQSDGVAGATYTMGADHRLLRATSNGVGDWRNNYLPDVRFMQIRPKGVASNRAYQAGAVHFFDRDVLSEGVGTFFIDPGLMVATSHGIGHMNDIERPTGVYMIWGSGKFFYSRRFPLIAPLLIPNGSNGMSYVRIEINGVPVMQNDMNGVGTMTDDIGGIAKGMRNSVCVAGSYPWVDSTEPGFEKPIRHAPYRPGIEALYGYQGILHTQGVEATLKPVEVVWMPNGIGHMKPSMRMAYILRWQRAGDSGFVTRITGNNYVGPAGGIGTMFLQGDRLLSSVSRGRANEKIRIDMSGLFATDLLANGFAEVLAQINGGQPGTTLYGNMLRYFFIPKPDQGQTWPRRERYVALSNTP